MKLRSGRAALLLALTIAPFFAWAQVDSAQVAPFVTTPFDVVDRMLSIANTGPADTVVDLGSGDGRIVIAAARKFGAKGLGLELDPKLVQQSREAARAVTDALPILEKASHVQVVAFRPEQKRFALHWDAANAEIEHALQAKGGA